MCKMQRVTCEGVKEVTTLTEKQIGRASASTNMTHTDKTESKWKEDDTGGVKKFQ